MPSPWDYRANWLILDLPRMGPMYYIGAASLDDGSRYGLSRILGTRHSKLTPLPEIKDIDRFYTYDAAKTALKVLMREPLKELVSGNYRLGIIGAKDGQVYATLPLTVKHEASPCKTSLTKSKARPCSTIPPITTTLPLV